MNFGRTLLPIFACTIAVAAAPQDPANSDITYVKIKPVTEDSAPPAHLFRESRIENLPLTIPGNVSTRIEENKPTIATSERPKSVENNPIKRESNFKPFVNEKINDEKDTEDDSSKIKEKIQTLPTPVISKSLEQRNPIKRESNSRPLVNEKQVIINDENDTEDNSDDVDNSRKIRSEDSTASYEADTVEPTEANTESVEQLLQQTEEYETRTKAPSPRFLSKLSYFKKDQVRSSIATNLVERVGKRKFKSKCRCEKIWNCGQGKLQITVPRCPNEYFLCCF